MQCNDQEGNTQCQQKTQHDRYIKEILTHSVIALICCVTVSQNVLCHRTELPSAHQHDGKVIDRPGPRRRVILQTTFSGPWDKATHWFLREKPHYGLSFISAVLGQFKPTQRTHFGSITEVMMDGKVWMGSSTVRGNTKMSLNPIITKLCFYKSL